MNFFQHQDASRRASRRLVFLFLLAVICVVAAVDLAVFIALWKFGTPDGQYFTLSQWATAHSGTVFGTTLLVIGIIGLASLYKTSVIGAGGGAVARSMGGVRISPDTTDPLQRRLLNVVEEMAIASGVPMPEVYLLEQESGINAFAAGMNPANAAIGVTRGALVTLNRTELQGVIGHEFSHILNGDMRLSTRLIGLLFGLLVIAILARTVLRFGPRGGRGKRDGGAGAIMLAALAVFVIGYVGLFFGRLIQAAVARRRESLADASSVQFTRDPSGLRNALVKIGALSSGSSLGTPQAEEVAHMLFAPGVSRMFATHPPLEARIREIDPHFDPREFDEMRKKLATATANTVSQDEPPAPRTSARALSDLLVLPTAQAGTVAALVGNPATAHIQLAQSIRESLPEAIDLAGRHPASARALLLGLALDRNPEARERQKRFIAQELGEDVITQIEILDPIITSLQPQQRIPAQMRAFAALRQLTHAERLQLLSCLNGMLQREGRLSLTSYVLRKLTQVQRRDDLQPGARTGRLPLASAMTEAGVVLSVLARHGHEDRDTARRAYEAGMHHVFPRERPAYAPDVDWALLDRALGRLDQLMPIAKEQIVEALTKTVTHDQQLTINEAELLRAVCASLHCPLPPLVNAAAA
jgi:Zn-dependent protease with chaperone function